MDKDSVVLVSDFPHRVTKYPVIGRITDVLSDRTYKVQYIKTEPETRWVAGRLTISKPAVTGELIRPAQRLVFLFNPNERNDDDEGVIIDPILGHQGAPPNIVQGPLAMDFVADADATAIQDVWSSIILLKIKNTKKNWWWEVFTPVIFTSEPYLSYLYYFT